jgi:hypothetical protein
MRLKEERVCGEIGGVSTRASMKRLAIPIMITALGVAWLLTAQEVLPAVSWPWTIGLAVAGLLSFIYLGFNKLSFVAGLFFLIASVVSLLRQTGRLAPDLEIPLLVIIFGLLLLLAQVLRLPRPAWIIEEEQRRRPADPPPGQP